MVAWFRLVVDVLVMIAVVSLGSAVVHLVRPQRGDRTRLAKALTVRIAVSLLAFVLLMVGYAQGWVHPHTLPQVTKATSATTS